MRFDLEGLEVFFPYDYLYKEQYEYMLHLKHALDNKGDALLEMPTGTGKTVCLLALITSYQFKYPSTGKLIYCTRTVPEMTKCMEEIKKVIAYREKELGIEGGKVLALCLSSRRNLCIHPRVIEEGDREAVDTLCRNMTASWVRNRILGDAARDKSATGCAEGLCEYYENYYRDGSQADIPCGIYSLDDLKQFGREKNWCPYFLTRHLISHASILVYNYQYMLDPKVANIVSRELESESIVVFDEAHNIDNVCIEALSVTVDKRMIDQSARGVNRLQNKVNELKSSDADKLRREYEALVAGLRAQNVLTSSSTAAVTATAATTTFDASSSSSSSSSSAAPLGLMADTTGASPVLSPDILEEAVPGNIRKAEHFLLYLKKLVLYLKSLFQATAVRNIEPLLFLHELREHTGLDIKPLQFTYTRLHSLLRTLEVTSLDEFSGLQEIANFITLVSTYKKGFAVILEPQGSITSGVNEPLVQLSCLDASIAIKPVLDRFQSVIITSGTLSPIDLYPKLLNFMPIVRVSLPMSTFRPCLLPLIVTRGSDQLTISTKFELRENISVLRNYAQLLMEVAANVPDGIVAFFTSYRYMEKVLNEWDKMGLLKLIMEKKLVFIETKDVVETTLALDNFRRACDCGRGAIFFSIARGKVAEGIDFDRHYGRAVLLFGIPYQYTLSQVLKARLSYMRETYQIRDDDFLTFDALRQSAQCVGRVIRSKTDYGIVVFADSRFQRKDTRERFPPWIHQFLRDSSMSLTTDLATEQIRVFLKTMAQPVDQRALRSILLDAQEVKRFARGYRWREGVRQQEGEGEGETKEQVNEFKAIPVPVDPQIVEELEVQAMDVAEAIEGEGEEYFSEMHGYLDENERGDSRAAEEHKVMSAEVISENTRKMRSSVFLFDDLLD